MAGLVDGDTVDVDELWLGQRTGPRRLRVERTVPGQSEPVLSDTQFAALATLEKHGAMSPGELAGHERVQPPI